MTAQTFLQLPPLGAGVWIPLVVGLVVACTALVACRFLGRRPAQPKPQDEIKAPQPANPKHASYDPFVQGSASEQRTAYRRTGNPVEVVITWATGTRAEMRGWVVDRSVGGLGLCAPQEVASGTLLKVTPPNTSGMTLAVEV